MGIHLRVGDSFIADVNRFGAAVIYATDNDVQVVQEALGTLNNSSLAREAVDYAYRHGVAVMASAADEAAQHNNWPSTLPHTIVANSVTTNDRVPAPDRRVLPRLQRLHQLQRQDHDRDPEHQLLVERGRARGRLRRPDLQRRPQRARRRRARRLSRSPRPAAARRRRPLPDHAERGHASCSPREPSTASCLRRRRQLRRARRPARATSPPARPSPLPDCTSPYGAGERAQGPGRRQPPGAAPARGRRRELPGARAATTSSTATGAPTSTARSRR